MHALRGAVSYLCIWSLVCRCRECSGNVCARKGSNTSDSERFMCDRVCELAPCVALLST